MNWGWWNANVRMARKYIFGFKYGSNHFVPHWNCHKMYKKWRRKKMSKVDPHVRWNAKCLCWPGWRNIATLKWLKRSSPLNVNKRNEMKRNGMEWYANIADNPFWFWLVAFAKTTANKWCSGIKETRQIGYFKKPFGAVCMFNKTNKPPHQIKAAACIRNGCHRRGTQNKRAQIEVEARLRWKRGREKKRNDAKW